MTLTDKELDLLNKLLPKYKAYKKPTQQQQLLVVLGEKPNKNDDDVKKLQLILSAEKKAIESLRLRASCFFSSITKE